MRCMWLKAKLIVDCFQEGREGRAKFGGGKKKGKPHAGKTNKTAKKGKAFQVQLCVSTIRLSLDLDLV